MPVNQNFANNAYAGPMLNPVNNQMYGSPVPVGAPNGEQQLNTNAGQNVNTTGFDLLNPTAFPWATNMGTTQSQGQNVSGGTTSGGSTQQGSGFSGLDQNTRNQLMSGILPNLLGSAQNLPTGPGQYAESGKKLYESMIRKALGDSMPGVLDDLAGRNIISGDIVSDTLAKSAAGIIPSMAMQGYGANMDAAQMAQNVPGILGQLLGLGTYSQNQSSGTSSSQSNNFGYGDTSSQGFNMSYNEDRSVPQQQLYDFIANMDPALLTG